MVYSLEDILGSNTTFDPLQLGIDVTPEAVKEACEKKEYLLALTVCDISPPFLPPNFIVFVDFISLAISLLFLKLSLRLSEKPIIRYVFDLIPITEIKIVVTNLPLFFLKPYAFFS